MRLPSKVTPYSQSILPKLPPILKELKQHDRSPLGLYKTVKGKFKDINEYIEALDCLYALKKVELLYPEEVLHYVD